MFVCFACFNLGSFLIKPLQVSHKAFEDVLLAERGQCRSGSVTLAGIPVTSVFVLRLPRVPRAASPRGNSCEPQGPGLGCPLELLGSPRAAQPREAQGREKPLKSQLCDAANLVTSRFSAIRTLGFDCSRIKKLFFGMPEGFIRGGCGPLPVLFREIIYLFNSFNFAA